MLNSKDFLKKLCYAGGKKHPDSNRFESFLLVAKASSDLLASTQYIPIIGHLHFSKI